MRKILIAYFSATGITARTAKKIAEAVDADLYEIRPQKPYTTADLDWMNKKSRSTLEMKDFSCRPAIIDQVNHMEQYHTILVGFPIWWYVEPRIVDTFLESYDFSGKTMIAFATSGSSGIEKAEQSLQARCPAADWRKGRLLRESEAQAWAEEVLLPFLSADQKTER